ncbi:MAG: selenium metabolism-associated LysR family transcriptional regulator [Candidatus Bathyarchaeia archaeon]|jgi:DNA-binding transcriptional LysR family regulator
METIRFDYLKTFLTVARTRSFSIAAKELGTSQGTVSHHIAALEECFDAELFKRTANGVEVTEAGATLKESTEKILEETQNAKTKISSAKHNLAGTIKIVASTIPEEHIIPSLTAEFQKKHPDVRFKIKAQDSITSLQSLQTNAADFAAVGTIQGYEEKFDAIQIGEEELVLIVPCNNELAKHKSVKIGEIGKYPFINREETSGTRKEMEKMFENNGISISQLRLGLELGSTESVITAVSEGRGVSVISSIAAKKAQAAGLARTIKIEEAKDPRKLYMVRPKRPLLKTCEFFWEFCKEYTFKNSAISCPKDQRHVI